MMSSAMLPKWDLDVDPFAGIAFAHCTCQGESLYYNTIGYDPAYAHWSPGNVLLFLILQQVFREASVRYFDFGPGEAQYKSVFSTNMVLVTDVFYFRRTLSNFLTVGVHFTLDRFSATIGRLLQEMGLKDKIRQIFRTFG